MIAASVGRAGACFPGSIDALPVARYDALSCRLEVQMDVGGLSGQRFAVLDTETTGIFPKRHDRVLEVAVVVVRADGRIEDEYSTLVNPDRDVGPMHIHGIRASDLVDAPTFEQVAGDVVARLRGTVVAGHNVTFDAGFLVAEYARFGVSLPPLSMICTLGLVSRLGVGTPTRKLADCCSALDIQMQGLHTALGDARATAALLTRCLRLASDQGHATLADLGCATSPSEQGWPGLVATRQALTRSGARRRPQSLLARLAASLPHDTTLSPNAAAYFDVLDRVLEDRVVTSDEADHLLALATGYGLSRGDVEALHHRYYAMVHRAAMADGRITAMEQRDLDDLRRLLGLADSEDVDTEPSFADPGPEQVGPTRSELVGKSVCFTGDLAAHIDGERVSRARARALAEGAGMTVAKNVTRRLDFLVLADPMSMSGKAKKAREYGVRLIAEPVFWRALDVDAQ